MGLQPPKDFRNSEFGIRNSEFGIRNSEFGIRNSEFRIRNSEFGIRNSEFGIVNSYGNSKVSHLGHRKDPSFVYKSTPYVYYIDIWCIEYIPWPWFPNAKYCTSTCINFLVHLTFIGSTKLVTDIR